MPAFELFQPQSVNDAVGVLNRHGADAWVMAGGMDTFNWLKDRIKKPKVVVDLGMINELRGVKDAGGGLEIGAMTTLTTVANDPMVKERFPLLATAALIVASPQIRNRARSAARVAGRAAEYYRAGGPATGPAATSATPTRRRRSTASTRSSTPIAAWR
jgi:xanthine dehydrogenase YagS FAD-binding subunit